VVEQAGQEEPIVVEAGEEVAAEQQVLAEQAEVVSLLLKYLTLTQQHSRVD
jgi:hypothetical protein